MEKQQVPMTDKLPIRGFDLYCEGVRTVEIAEILRVKLDRVNAWRKRYSWVGMRDGVLPLLHVDEGGNIYRNETPDPIKALKIIEAVQEDETTTETRNATVSSKKEDARKSREQQTQQHIAAIREDLMASLAEKGLTSARYTAQVDDICSLREYIETCKTDIAINGVMIVVSTPNGESYTKDNPAVNMLDKLQKSYAALVDKLSLSADKTLKHAPQAADDEHDYK